MSENSGNEEKSTSLQLEGHVQMTSAYFSGFLYMAPCRVYWLFNVDPSATSYDPIGADERTMDNSQRRNYSPYFENSRALYKASKCE